MKKCFGICKESFAIWKGCFGICKGSFAFQTYDFSALRSSSSDWLIFHWVLQEMLTHDRNLWFIEHLLGGSLMIFSNHQYSNYYPENKWVSPCQHDILSKLKLCVFNPGNKETVQCRRWWLSNRWISQTYNFRSWRSYTR